ncbi:MAG: hypothetical protein GX484_17815, partial [Chloroflexi bacterium]|nr:hypothetical protein [Chloroflexota bacterium]
VAGSKLPVAWITVDEADDDPTTFLTYLIAALNQLDSRIGQAVLESQQRSSPTELVATLINDLARAEFGALIVLDDYHFIRSFETHDLLAFFLENRPPGVHVAIGTREDPPLPLARLRARDQVTEIRERALRFAPEETAAFLNQTMQLGLSAGAISALAARTEGWITGLQLAGLALRQQGDAEAFVEAFAGDDRYIVDYLMAEVLARVPEPLREFLRQTSILERFSAPLCDALTGRSDSQAVLEHLESANLFVMPLDHRRQWYRYHGLFAEVLRLTLPDDEQVSLHQRAAAWYRAHGFDALALHHQRAAADLLPTSSTSRRPADQPLIEPLSERELEVLNLIAAGYSNAEIAERLVIAVGTVKRHINNLYGKLGAGSRTQALAIARELGLMD